MNKTHILTFVAAVFLVFGCNFSKKEKPLLLADFVMSKYIASYFAAPADFDVNSKIKDAEILNILYQKNQNEPFWFTDNQPNMQAKQMLDLLANSMNYGLDTTLYDLPTVREFVQGFSQDSLVTNQNKQSMLGYELCLTQSAIRFFTNLNRGIMPFDPEKYITTVTVDSTSSYRKIYNHFDDFPQDSLVNILCKTFKTDTIKTAVDLFQPQNIHYKRLQKALEDYVLNTPINKDSIQVVYYEKDTVWTSTFDNYRKGCLALQKLRWSDITAKHYIFINIPSFTLDLVEENELALSHKIICGKPENQTPELNSRLRQIRLFPEWNIPFSIATKEILPIVKRNTNYLAKNNYEVLDSKGNVLNPDSVPWKKYTETYFPVRIRQTAGYHNSLGIVMFYFENTSAVYFHDTPAKGLFNHAFRAFSHGCMRMQNPLAFAKAIMEFDNGILHLSKETLTQMGIFESNRHKKDAYNSSNNSNSERAMFQNKLQEQEKHFYNVKRNIPIYIRYLTAYCDENGQICFTPDFYGRDTELTALFEEAMGQ